MTHQSGMEAEEDYYNDTWNDTWNTSYDMSTRLERGIINSFMSVACIFGLLGNGTVIWLLGVRLKRTRVTTYILNLAVADFGVLISLILKVVSDIMNNYFDIIPPWWCPSFDEDDLFQFAYSTSQFLLTTISMDRCVSVLFPLWYQCHRPENLSSTICVILWFFCFLLNGLRWILPVEDEHALPQFYVFLVTAVICLPLITISTLILFVRFYFKSQQRQRGKLLTVILLTLFFFLILAFPMNAFYLVTYRSIDHTFYFYIDDPSLLLYGWFCASLNSFVNPIIYFLVGRRKRGLCRENLKLILQRIFKEENASGE